MPKTCGGFLLRLIAGTRTITDMQLVRDAIKESEFIITTVLCGESRRVDTLGGGIPAKRQGGIEQGGGVRL